ncbi:MAG TPA: M20/M25/M40 family metallo-hydrolase [Nitrososphaerales archaeon]|nr:M20/M25/M40 family metallo-hydrolase [Nitrososphaerales archaeon]
MTGAAVSPLRLLLDSLEIYSPTTQEAKLAAFLTDRMGLLGYSKVHIDKAGNAIGEIGKGKTRLLLCGHMDTVPGKLPVSRKQGRVYGRGAADAKSPLCALLLAGAGAADSGVSITFAGVTQEEGEGAGVEQLIRSGDKFDCAVFGEPSGANRITIGYRGRVSLYVTVRTSGGHAGSPWAQRSAYDEFNLLLTRLKRYEHSKEIPGDHFRSVSISPTLVRAGTYHNVIPNMCEATLDVRLPPSVPSFRAIEEIRHYACQTDEGVTIDVSEGEPTEAYEADTASTLVRAFQRAILLKLKTRPSLVRKTGTGDMSTFAQKKSAACVTYGPGLSRTSHTDGEMVQVKDYLGSIEVLKEAILQLDALGLGSGI